MVTQKTTTKEELLAEIQRQISVEGECHVWRGFVQTNSGRPIVQPYIDGKRTTLNVQRHIWNSHNEILRVADVLSTSCQNERCVNVSHLCIKVRKQDPEYSTPDHEAVFNLQRLVTAQGDCRLWNGKVRGRGIFERPIGKKYAKGVQREFDIQRHIWNLTHENITGHNILVTSCSRTNCIAPSHLVMSPKAQKPNWDNIWATMLSKTVPKAPPMHSAHLLQGDCLIWAASKIGSYGQQSIKGTNMSAHRASFLVKTKGAEIPTHLNGAKAQIRHLCGRPLCVAHNHLIIGTCLENAADRIGHGTHAQGDKSKRAKMSEETATMVKLSRVSKGTPGYATQTERAKKFGVTLGMVQSIDCGAAWGHIKSRDGTVTSVEKLREKKRARYRTAQDREWTDSDYTKAAEQLYAQVSKSETSKKFKVDGECWNYTGYIPPGPDGYGRAKIMGRQKASHTMSCEIKERRAIKKSEHTLHLCANPRCIAPHHLTFGSPRENALTSVRNGSKTTKLDENKVRKIRDLTNSKADLALEFDVSEDTIRNVRDGRTWTHVK